MVVPTVYANQINSIIGGTHDPTSGLVREKLTV
jgi:hypothetical protein